MQYETDCPNCREYVHVEDVWGTSKIDCPHCGSKIEMISDEDNDGNMHWWFVKAN